METSGRAGVAEAAARAVTVLPSTWTLVCSIALAGLGALGLAGGRIRGVLETSRSPVRLRDGLILVVPVFAMLAVPAFWWWLPLACGAVVFGYTLAVWTWFARRSRG